MTRSGNSLDIERDDIFINTLSFYLDMCLLLYEKKARYYLYRYDASNNYPLLNVMRSVKDGKNISYTLLKMLSYKYGLRIYKVDHILDDNSKVSAIHGYVHNEKKFYKFLNYYLQVTINDLAIDEEKYPLLSRGK